MDFQIVSVVAAGLGVIFSIAFLVLGLVGVKTLRDVRDRLTHR